MSRFLNLAFLGLLALGGLTACQGNNNSQSIPYVSPLGIGTTGVVPECAPGTVGCPLVGATGAYITYVGTLANVNGSIAQSIAASVSGMTTYCWGNCYGPSTIELNIPAGGVTGVLGQATLTINNYPISGQAYVFSSGNGADIQITAFGINRIDIITNMPLNGTIAIPAAQVLYAGKPFATATLVP